MTTPETQLDFEAKRRLGVGGSDAAAIVGLSPYGTALDVYNEKLGLAPAKTASAIMLRGRYLEAVAVEIYCDVTGKKVRKQPQRTHAEYPFIIGNIDRQILANGDERGTGLLEVKCPGIRTFLRYGREGVPPHIICQCQHYLGVFGYQWMEVVLFNADLWKLVHFEIKRDDAFIEGLFEAERRFWREHVEKQVPPPATGMLHAALPDLEEMPPIDGQLVQREDPEWAEAAVNLAQARTLRESAEAVEESAISRVKELAGSLGVYEGGDLRVYWKQQPGRVTFDRKALEAAQPLDRMKVFGALAGLVLKDGTIEMHVEEMNKALGACTVDFKTFEKVGKPFETFRPYFLKPQGPENE